MEPGLKGIIPPMITPLSDYDKLDVKGLVSLVEYLINGGVHGLFILGTNGEAPSLSQTLKKELIKRTCEQVNHRIPVLVGVSDPSFAESLDIFGYSKQCGADAVVAAPPYYYPVDQEEIVKYFDALSNTIDLPLIFYNIPSHTKVYCSMETIKKIKELGAIGIKDSSGDMFFLYSIIEEFKNASNFSIFTGTELYLPETILNGGHGAIAGGANIFPSLFVSLYEACIQKDTDRIGFLRGIVMKLYNTIYSVGKHPSRVTAGTKCALSLMGICNDYMAPPLNKMNERERKQIKEFLDIFSNMLI